VTIVSLYVVLIISVQIFDLGLAQTLNRELARWRRRSSTNRSSG